MLSMTRILFPSGLFLLLFLPGCANPRIAERSDGAPVERLQGVVKAAAAHLTLSDGETCVELHNLLFYAGDRYLLLRANERTFVVDTIVAPSLTVSGTSILVGERSIAIGDNTVTIDGKRYPSADGDIFLIRGKGKTGVVERLNDRSMDKGIEKAGFDK